MDTTKFALWSRGVLGSLATIAAAGVLIATGQPADPELLDTVETLGSETIRLAAELAALLGGVLALVGRVRATKGVRLLP